MEKFSVLFRREEESFGAFTRRIAETAGDMVVVLSSYEAREIPADERKNFVAECAKLKGRLRLATKDPVIVAAARAKGIRVIDRTKNLKSILKDHESAGEALRAFSPHLWRQQLRSRLQAMGLLSLPKIRIWVLTVLSTCLFLFVILRLLPSAEVQVWPRQDTISQTANVFLVLSGATVDVSPHVRAMELIPIKVTVRKALSFDQISKEFIGRTAEATMTVYNNAKEPYGLRAGTRLQNQAGMVFRTQEPLVIEPGQQEQVKALADPEDIYGVIIGARGNVPANLRWDIPGLSTEEQKLVYAKNKTAAKGGTTAYRTVLHEKDLKQAQLLLEKELLATAQQMVEEERDVRNALHPDQQIEVLSEERYSKLRRIYYYDFTLPTDFLGKPVTSIPVEGSIDFKQFAYDSKEILGMLSRELQEHAEEGKMLLVQTLGLENLVVHVIGFDDDLNWIKLTVDLTATEQFILDPLTPNGLRFGRKVRQAIAGTDIEEAKRIVKNFPEVEKVEISLWPPWNRTLPALEANIAIAPQ